MTITAFFPLSAVNLEIWLGPFWLLAFGVTVGAVILAALWGVLWLVSRSRAMNVLEIIQEGPLMPVSYVVLTLVGFTLVASSTMDVRAILSSMRRLSAVGPQQITVEIAPRTEDVEVPLQFDADELQRYSFASNQDLRISMEPGVAFSDPLLVVEGDQPFVWTPSAKFPRYFNEQVERIFVTNESDAAADLTIDVLTDVELPEVHHVPIAAASVVGLYLFYLLLNWLLPGLSAIAVTTAKEAMSQPLFAIVLLVGIFALLIFVVVPYNTFGEDVKVLRNTGFETIMALSVVFALWTASTSVADEIEGRTAITLLSKPISRRQFVLGKFLGIVWPILVLFVILGIWLMFWVSFKVVYDARETANPNPNWQLCYGEMMRVVPGLVLTFFETVVLAAISVAISTRLPFMPNLLICGTIYVLGHLGTRIVQSSAVQLEFVGFIGRLVALVVPVLDHFNIQAAVAGGVDVPMAYLGWALLYCVLYSTVAMLLALILFEDRDLA
jgi:ABC-type transport system involved in multi-copper enzyme maturation permease subunit